MIKLWDLRFFQLNEHYWNSNFLYEVVADFQKWLRQLNWIDNVISFNKIGDILKQIASNVICQKVQKYLGHLNITSLSTSNVERSFRHSFARLLIKFFNLVYIALRSNQDTSVVLDK